MTNHIMLCQTPQDHIRVLTAEELEMVNGGNSLATGLLIAGVGFLALGALAGALAATPAIAAVGTVEFGFLAPAALW